MTGECIKCTRSFRYKDRGRKRVICNRCLSANMQAHMLRRRQSQKKLASEEHARSLDAAGITLMDHGSVAKLQGLSPKRVQQIERQAFAKIRSHPEARKLFKFWMQEGCPTEPKRQQDPAELFLNFHLNLAEWWAIYQDMYDRGLSSEAEECKQQIDEFYRVMRKALKEFDPHPYTWVRNLTQ
jgi:hypothetical protein